MNLFGRRRPQSPDATCAKVIAILTDRFGALPMPETFPMHRLPHRGFDLVLDWTHPRDDLWQLVVVPYSNLVVALAEQDGVAAWNCTWRARWGAASRSLRVDVCTEKNPARMALVVAPMTHHLDTAGLWAPLLRGSPGPYVPNRIIPWTRYE